MLDYIHSAETEQFSFLRVPKILLQNDTFKGISAEAKLLYSILFDRTELSNRNGWRDDQDRVYIIFTIAEITESMNWNIRQVSSSGTGRASESPT